MSSLSTRKLNPLTSLRFFAAAAVVWVHSATEFQFEMDPYQPVALADAVSFFFVLSGFILTYVYGSQPGLEKRRFLLARVARIWPAHIAALVLFLFLIPASEWRESSLGTWLANVTMTHTWMPEANWRASFVMPSWSISTEFAFYLCFLFLIPGWKRTWPWKLAASFLLLIGTCAYSNWLLSDAPLTAGRLVYVTPYARLFEFVLGMSTAALWERFSPRIRLHPALATLLECAALLLVYFAMAKARPWSLQAARMQPFTGAGEVWLLSAGFSCWAFAAFIFAMALGQGLLSRLLSWSFFVLLGEISYSLYLVHMPIATYLARHPMDLSDTWRWTAYPIYCLVILATSYLIWALVERPCRHFLVRLWPRRSNLIAVELPASMITPQGAPVEPAHRGVVLPSWPGVAIAAGGLVFLLILPAWLPPDTGSITVVGSPESPYYGFLDKADTEQIAGWAWNSQKPREHVTVEIYDREKFLLTVVASRHRRELANALGDSAHAFVLPTPEALRDGQPHEIHARVERSLHELPGSPRRFHFPPKPPR